MMCFRLTLTVLIVHAVDVVSSLGPGKLDVAKKRQETALEETDEVIELSQK